jgi:hypothetical protein
VNDIEDRLRDAYRGAAETVRPESLRGLAEQGDLVTFRASGRAHRWLMPMTAAAAVIAVVLGLTVIVPHVLEASRGPSRSVAGNPATQFLVAITSGHPQTITVHKVATGATVSSLVEWSGGNFTAAATGNGRTYVVVASKPNTCGSWLDQITLTRQGRFSHFKSFAPGYVNQAISQLAVSQNGRILAFAGDQCTARTGPLRPDLGVINLATGHVTDWPLAGVADTVHSLSLTANGRVLAYSLGADGYHFRPGSRASGVFVLRTDALPGPVAQRSRAIVTVSPDRLGAAVITPDGTTIYFVTGTNRHSALRMVNVGRGGTRIVTDFAGFAADLVANPSVNRAILFILSPHYPAPVSSPSPSPSPSLPAPSASPSLPAPSASPSYPPAPSEKPTPSPFWPRRPTPFPTATPSSAPAGSPVPSADITLTAAQGQPTLYSVRLVDLSDGRTTALPAGAWKILTNQYVW